MQKNPKNQPLINSIINQRLKGDLVIVITAGARRTTRVLSMKQLKKIKSL